MKTLLLVACAAVCFNSCLCAADPARAETTFKKLLAAQTAKDYDAFVADADDVLRAALTKTQFEASSNLMSTRFAGGYESTYLGDLNQKGYEVYLYRLRFKDGSDDMLAPLSLKDGKVGGIFFR